MIIKIDYGDKVTEFHNVSYHTCKAFEEILHDIEFQSSIVSKEVVRDIPINHEFIPKK